MKEIKLRIDGPGDLDSQELVIAYGSDGPEIGPADGPRVERDRSMVFTVYVRFKETCDAGEPDRYHLLPVTLVLRVE
jgi:hypothetical protein